MSQLEAFLKESNDIEGISKVSAAEIKTAKTFLKAPQANFRFLLEYLRATQPNARLREEGCNVCVGAYRAPSGGTQLDSHIFDLLEEATRISKLPKYRSRFRESAQLYILFEQLHPFNDGNGRTGRLLWRYAFNVEVPSFLKVFHYQTLDAAQIHHPYVAMGAHHFK